MRDDINIPNMGQAPKQYEETHLNRLVRNIEMTLSLLRSKGKVSATEITADSILTEVLAVVNILIDNAIVNSTLRLPNTTSADLTSTGHAFQIGPSDVGNIRMDNNDIMSVDNGVAAALRLNRLGGDVEVGASTSTVSSAGMVRLTNTTELTLASTTHAFQIGLTSGPNLAADPNEIQARNNGAAAVLNLQPGGGDIDMGNASSLVNLPGGALVFPATQVSSSNVNTLDDYEEGSWTPVLAFGGGVTGMAYTTQRGRYIKIGKLVFVEMEILLSAKGTDVGSASVSGLPFATASTRTLSMAVGLYSGFTGLTGALQLAANGSTINFRQSAATGSSTVSDPSFTATSRIMAGGTYEAST